MKKIRMYQIACGFLLVLFVLAFLIAWAFKLDAKFFCEKYCEANGWMFYSYGYAKCVCKKISDETMGLPLPRITKT